MKKIVFLILLCSITINVFADEQQDQMPKSIKIAYFGEFVTHPGLIASLEIPFYKMKGHLYFVTIKGGGYTH